MDMTTTMVAEAEAAFRQLIEVFKAGPTAQEDPRYDRAYDGLAELVRLGRRLAEYQASTPVEITDDDIPF